MLSFFRKVRRLLLAENKLKKYLLYAIGEIVLVMIGILLALQVNNWNEYRKERIEEDKILHEINRNLEIDIQSIDRNLIRSNIQGEKIEKLLSVIEQDLEVKGDGLDTLFFAVLQYFPFSLNITPFQELNARGINIISNDSLRLQLINVYEFGNRRLEFINDSEQKMNEELLRPYYLKNFNNLYSLKQKATPKNIEKVLNDDYYVNILGYRMVIKKRNQAWWTGVQKEMIELKKMIDSHFEKRKKI